ncbi:hypothetical protein [Roseimaritima ulvae]|uniref:Cbb3-type cytochrome oxidase component FixQ n=1 Tax=Roseimaritima ulvae TaxID=980254 RepID=A0A5B9QKX8_9BACT|nr:hypothetical protein [Roseimaritima ulvae]QEG39564.1 hypothetical protein UC8_15590 [Roseimaritima ulvae]
MIRDLVSYLDYSICAEWALGLFFAAFTGIVFSAFRLSRDASERFAAIAISDQVEDPRDE